MYKLLFTFLLFTAAASAGETPWNRIVAPDAGDPVNLAVNDLQRYLAQVTHQASVKMDAPSWELKHESAVVLVVDATRVEELGPQGYHLANESGSVIITAAAPEGLVNGVYGLLRELGFRFFLGSEHIPENIPDALPVTPITRKPALTTRGVLPWYNFFNSPTTWDIVDHRAFADQIIRMGANFVGFHSYDMEPFAGYTENGEIKYASRLLSTSSPTWGANPLKTRDFAFGTDMLFADDYFGAATTRLDSSNAEAVRIEQEVMRDALDYAKRRGLTTCLGFEMNGDPTVPEMREAFLKRLNHVLDTYPTLDVIWLWQSETQGAQGFAQSYNQHILPYALPKDSPLIQYGMDRRDVFKRIVDEVKGATPFYQNTEAGKMARATEGARLEQFASLAIRAMRHRAHAPKLAISGWGGDERLLSADYYEGLDILLPEDVIFTSLDNIGPLTRVDKVYSLLSPARQRWPIPWLENDGDQWRPQPYVHIYEALARVLLQGGSQGVLGIHWRTRDIEENIGYLVDFAWNPTLTAKDYFNDVAYACYPLAIREEMADLLNDLDVLGYSWVGGSGQNECAPFSWGLPDKAGVEVFEKLRERAKTLLPKSGDDPRLRWLLNNMDWVSSYAATQFTVQKATELITTAHSAGGEERARLANEALATLDNGAFPAALRSYARRLSTRGEYGVLATINTKAVVAWRQLRSEAAGLAGIDTPPETTKWNTDPIIVLPRLIGTIPAGQDFVVEPIVLGGGNAWIHYRSLGEAAWSTAPLEIERGWVQRGVIPGDQIKSPGLEFGFSFSADPAAPMAFGPVGVTATVITTPDTTPIPPADEAIASKEISIRVEPGSATLTRVLWDDIPDADYFRVYRDETLAVETAIPLFPDNPVANRTTYRVEAIRDRAVIAKSSSVVFDVSALPVRAPGSLTDIHAMAGPTGVRILWQTRRSPYTTSFSVARRAPGATWETLGQAPVNWDRSFTWQDTPAAGSWEYQVTPTGPTGLVGEAGVAAVAFTPTKSEPVPSLAFPLTSPPDDARVTGDWTFGRDGGRASIGSIRRPGATTLNPGQPMTLHVEFKVDQMVEMPVIVCHGAWNVDGWFMQILNGALLVRLPGGDAQGPLIQPGKWYSVDFVYDGAFVHLAVDGAWLPQVWQRVNPNETTRDLVIGCYDVEESRYQFKGEIRNIRFYDTVALDVEIK